MKAHFTFILALSTTVAACGHSGQDLFLDQGSAALGCGAPGEPKCSSADDPSDPSAPSAPPKTPYETASSDAGTTYERRCDVDTDCEYGEVCEHRHGPNRCAPAGYDYDDHGGDDHGGDDHGHDDDGTPDQGRGDTGADAGTPAVCDDDGYATDDRCTGKDDHDDDHADDDYGYDDHGGDRSGSSSGPH